MQQKHRVYNSNTRQALSINSILTQLKKSSVKKQTALNIMNDLNLTKVKSFEIAPSFQDQEIEPSISKLTETLFKLKYQSQQLQNIMRNLQSLLDISEFQSEQIDQYSIQLNKIKQCVMK
ncbi:Hypothetical_protein [Hexamita inflata]|uniref:Hypothetical_protein n=1 Tax=Hexamita inflata TaxID=28002 RepID=A0AA86RFQ7_9EUKA|nr:Hypothetical protein HINF_LOCUS7373 [Hexamita inflata]CAI9972077.1 Hypothetical protein HINF_LOCUS59722 [Hexamita inflata]